MKKIKYIFWGLNLFKIIDNWYVLPLAMLGLKSVIKLKNGLEFIINDYMNLLALLEIFYAEDYKYKGNLKHIKTILDIGANIGDSAIYYAWKFPQAKVIAFEPNNKLFFLLRENIMLNNFSKNIEPLKVAITNKSGFLTFYINKFSGQSGIVKMKRDSKATRVPAMSYKKMLDKYKINHCDLVKIDCEGGEYDILLKTEDRYIKKVRNYIIEYHDGLTKHSHGELIKKLKNLKYKVKVKKHPFEYNIGIIYASK